VLGLSDHYGHVRTVVPSWVTLLIIDPGSAGLVLCLAGFALAGLVLEWRRRGYDRRWTIPLVVLALNVPHVFLVWHGSNAELGRHSLELAISARLALWALALLLVDRWLADRDESGTAVPSNPS
jgi:4-amino-4-deoxy-L-arabinose transferase-like glycosyltransferase